MTAADVATAAEQNALLRLFRQVMPTIIAAAIIAAFTFGYSEHVARLDMQASLASISQSLQAQDEKTAATAARQAAMETRLREVETRASAAGAQATAVNDRLDRIERLLERLVEGRNP